VVACPVLVFQHLENELFTAFYTDITAILGYNESPLFREDAREGLVALSDYPTKSSPVFAALRLFAAI